MDKRAQELIAEMERLGEEKCFTKEERNRLQKVFTNGKLSENICWIGWVEYKDNNGETHYEGNFSEEVMDLMVEICNERIKAAKERSEAYYNDFSLQNFADFINGEIKSLRNIDARSYERERLKKNAMESVADVECGKLNLEGNKPSYDCIVVRQRTFYSGSIIIEKTDFGYRVECRVPLAGKSSCNLQKDEIFSYLKEKTSYIIY